MLIIRNLPDDVHRALLMQAALHDRSTEAEMRDILATAVRPETQVRLGDALAALSRSTLYLSSVTLAELMFGIAGRCAL